MCRRTAVSLLGPALVLLDVACGGSGGDRVEVRIGRLVIQAELARTAEERALGLGGRDAMAPDAGMLFVFPQEHVPVFWMQGMRFPLDFIWISRDGRVVDLTEEVPPPAPGTPDAELPRYTPSAPVLYALEVNAGVIDQAGVEVGDTVAFDPDVSPADVR